MQDRFTYSDDEIKALINCHYHRIVAYIRKFLGNHAPVCDAEDLLHDAVCLFIEKKVAKKQKSLQDLSALSLLLLAKTSFASPS